MTVLPDSDAPLWSIGADNLDPRVFSDHWFADGYVEVPPFQIGVSDHSKDWPRVQPGPLDASTQFRPVSLTIVFDVDPECVPRAGFALELDFFASHGPCPQLEVDLNGHRGVVHPRVLRESRVDANTRVSPTAGRCHRILHLPDGVVTAGRNELRVTTIASTEPDATELVAPRLPGLGAWFGSAITWRRLSLRTGVTAPCAVVDVDPLPLFVHDADSGGLMELIDVTVATASAFSRSASLSLHGKEYAVELGGDARTFGDFRARLGVPEWAGETDAWVAIDIEGTKHTFVRTARAARKWTVHVLPHVHLDLGYTDAQAKVIELHSRNLERASDLSDSRDDYRFTVDGSHTLGHFLSTRIPERQAAALAALHDGRLAVNAFSVLFLSGLASLEELYRSTSLAFDLADRDQIAVSHAHLTDVPSYSSALPGVLRSMGLDGFFGIANHNRAANADSDELHLQSPVRWQGADGQDVLCFFSDCYTQLRFVCADPPTIPGLEDGLSRLLGLYDRDDYLPQDLPLVGTHTDNEDLADGYASLVSNWSAKYAYPQLRYSTFVDYLDAVRPLRDQLPVVTGDGGSYWEDAAGTQAAVIAEYREAQVTLPAAEALGALTSIAYAGTRPDREALDRAWDDLLLGCEHTWTSAHATSRPDGSATHDQLDWKVSRVHAAARAGRDQGLQALSRLAELMALRAPALLVFNSSSRTRDLVVEHDLRADARILDTSDRELPIEVIRTLAGGMIRARLTVPAVSAFGYQALHVEGGGKSTEPDWAVTTVVTTGRYEVGIDPESGQVDSLVHRASGRQLLSQESGWSLGQVLYVTGGGDAESRGVSGDITALFDFDPALPPPRLQTTPASMRVIGSTRIPRGVLIRLQGSAPTLPKIVTDIRLYDDRDDVEVSIELAKEHELAKESVYVAFPFDVAAARLRYDRQIGWVDPSQDHMAGACNDWFALQNGVSLTDPDGSGLVWASADAPLFTVEPVGGQWRTVPAETSGLILSWVMNNYWWTNTPASQGGELRLRYAFKPMDTWDEADATKFVRDHRAVTLVDEVIHQDRTQSRPARIAPGHGVLLETRVPDNVDLRVYSGRRTPGLDVRAQEIAGRSAEVRLRHPDGAVGKAWIAHPSGRVVTELTPDADGWLTTSVGPYRDVTVVLATDERGPGGLTT